MLNPRYPTLTLSTLRKDFTPPGILGARLGPGAIKRQSRGRPSTQQQQQQQQQQFFINALVSAQMQSFEHSLGGATPPQEGTHQEYLTKELDFLAPAAAGAGAGAGAAAK
eukprot:1139836-Pelagomonas_calceolata.AAC.2